MEHALLVGGLQPYLMEEKNKYSQFILDHAGLSAVCRGLGIIFLFTVAALGKRTHKYQNQR